LFQANITIFYYLTYWRQVSLIKPSSGPPYIKFKTGYMLCTLNSMSYGIPSNLYQCQNCVKSLVIITKVLTELNNKMLLCLREKNTFFIVFQYHCHLWATESEMPLDKKWNKLHPSCRASTSPTLSLFTQLQRAQWHSLQAAAILFDFRHYIFYVIHIHAQTVKFKKYINKCSNDNLKFLQLKH